MAPSEKVVASRDSVQRDLQDPDWDILEPHDCPGHKKQDLISPEMQTVLRNQETMMGVLEGILETQRDVASQLLKPSAAASSAKPVEPTDSKCDEAAEAAGIRCDSEEQRQIRQDLGRFFTRFIEMYHGVWIDRCDTPDATARKEIQANAEDFFIRLRRDWLPLALWGREDDHPLFDLLERLSPRSQAIMYLHYNKLRKETNKGRNRAPAKGTTARKAQLFSSS